MWPPNYFDVYERRRKAVVRWRKNPKILQAAHAAYAVNPADFISDLVDTFDPRNAAKGEMTRLPFVLFRRQRELIEFLSACLDADANGIVEKSRDVGATWLAVSISRSQSFRCTALMQAGSRSSAAS
jgi:phage terminase large subunit